MRQIRYLSVKMVGHWFKGYLSPLCLCLGIKLALRSNVSSVKGKETKK